MFLKVSVRSLLLMLSLIITLFPAFLVPTFGNFSAQQILIELMCIGFLISCYLSAPSQSFKLFWQYLTLAALCPLLNYFAFGNSNLIGQQLFNDFSSLFSYFFIVLAIETKPHANETTSDSYKNSRAVSIMFVVVCFVYFVLLPAQYAASYYQQQIPSLLFNIAICLLISVRLLFCWFRGAQHSWYLLYAPLAFAAIALLTNYMLSLSTLLDRPINVPIYLNGVLALAPYCLLTIAAYVALTKHQILRSITMPSKPELYILTLIIAISLAHLVGSQQQFNYVLDTPLQTLTVALWILIGAGLLWRLSTKHYQQQLILEQQLTQSKVEQSDLNDQQQHLRHLILNSEDSAIVYASNNAILTTNLDGEILSANPAAVQLFQILEQALKGSCVSSLFDQQDEMHFFFDYKSNVYSLQRKQTGISKECLSLRSDGQSFPVQVELQWAQRQDQPLIVITFINLTARKRAEQQTLELKDKFIANISHEFRTPLTIINGIIDRYLDQTKDQQEQQDLVTAKRNGIRLVTMVEQLLELSRLSDNPTLNLSHYRLETLMAMPIDSFSRLANQNSLQFSSDIPSDLWLECDAQGFEKIIFNLLANAVKYTPANGEIKVIAFADNDQIIIDIIDSGIGISEQSQQSIFQRFVRDESATLSTFGVGIGLSLVSELVKSHDWRISLSSKLGHGSKFSLSLPLAPPGEIDLPAPSSLSANDVSALLTTQQASTIDNQRHNHQVVLVIEDNLDMQSHIKQVVEQQHHCLLAGSGELGLELAQEYLPDLIVCDLMLTGIDGFEVLSQIKQHELTAHIPVILLTARSDLDSRLKGLNLNADEYLSKPFNQHELLTRIQNLIENRKNLQQTYLSKFNLELKKQRCSTSQKNAANLSSNDDEPSLDEKFLAKLEAVVAKLYSEPTLDVTQIAAQLALSERQLQRKIKVLLATTPNNFIKEFRLNKAQDLLKNGYQIGRIALDVGFSSQTYFGRCFKETYQCTPKQYQQQYQTKPD